MNKRRLFSLILIFALLFQTVGCAKTNVKKEQTDASQIIENIKKSQKSQTDGTKSKDDNKQQQTDHVKTEQVTLSAENTSVEICGIKVDVGEFVLDEEEEEELIVTKLPEETTETGDQLIDVYEIYLGERSELGDFITIRLPYRTDFCDPGEDPAECVQGQYRNEETGEWVTTLYTVDAENQEVIITTDHLTDFGVSHVKKPCAKALSVDFTPWQPEDPQSFENDDSGIELITTYLESDNKPLALKEIGAKIYDNLLKKSEIYEEYISGYADNFTQMITLGEKDFAGLFSDELSGACEAIGYAALAIRIIDIAVRGGTDKAKLDVLKDLAVAGIRSAANRFTASGSAAFGLALTAVWIFGKALDYACTEANKIIMENTALLYEYFNNTSYVSRINHKARTKIDWRKEFIKIVEENVETPELIEGLINENIDDYCAKFWQLEDRNRDVITEIADDARKNGVKRMDYHVTTPDQQAQITADYKHNLMIELAPYIESIPLHFRARAEQEYQNILNNVENYFNTPIETYVYEKIDKDEQTYKYPGYIVQFGPLSENANIERWTTGTIDENGQHVTSFTILGYILSGCPTEVYLFKPDADLSEDEPAETLQLKFSETYNNRAYASIEGGLEGRFAGTYTNVGSQIEVNSVKVSDKLYDKTRSLGHWTSKSQWENWLTEKFYYALGISKFIDVDKCLPNDPGNNYYDIYFTIGTVINNTSQEFHFVNTATLENDQFIIYEGNVRGTLDVTIDEEQELARITGNDLEFAFTGNELNEIVGELAMPVDYEAYYLYFDVDATKPLEAGFLELD